MLDAWVTGVINNRAFRAELSNGHGFVAFRTGPAGDAGAGGIAVGRRIRVEFSPCDMSKARVVGGAGNEGAT